MRQASARERLDQALSRIADPKGEGRRACLTIYADTARAAAEAADARMRAGQALGPLDGAIVTIKDLFDVAGEVTRAGSRIVAEEGKPAASDAPVVRRLRAAGAVIVAKTNMSEFAFHGVGTNPHFGTPGNPADRERAPGGSTSGGAVAVADGMCEIAIGSDTGGSTRAPAALCGIVGWKPSRQRVPTQGAFPLSFTLDSIGPLARTRRRVRSGRCGDGRRRTGRARCRAARRAAVRHPAGLSAQRSRRDGGRGLAGGTGPARQGRRPAQRRNDPAA